MIGMSLGAFATLFVISAIWSVIVHGVVKYRVLTSFEGYFTKLIAGWIGAWLGSPVLGYWGPQIAGVNVYLVPAILGSIAAIFLGVATFRALGMMLRPLARPQVEAEARRVA